MEFRELIKKAKEIKESYAELNEQKGEGVWGVVEYTQGFVGDVGDLTKLVMAKKGFRSYEDVDEKLAHELADCLWSVVVIAEELDIDLESEFLKTMEELKQRISSEK